MDTKPKATTKQETTIEFENDNHRFFYFRKVVQRWKDNGYKHELIDEGELHKILDNYIDVFIMVLDHKLDIYRGVLEYEDGNYIIKNPYVEDEDDKHNITHLKFNGVEPRKLNALLGVYYKKSTPKKSKVYKKYKN